MVKGYDKFDAKTAGGMHGKHYSHNDYFEHEKTVEGKVFGNLAEDLGLQEGQAITSKQFKDLSENKHAVTGEQLTKKKSHTEEKIDPKTGEVSLVEVSDKKPFCDMTVSMPKTWSIQGEIAGDKRVLEYHQLAKEKVKAEFYSIVGRQAHNGIEHLELTGSMAGVEYHHDTNRCQEVQIHDHLIFWNATRSKNGKLYAIDFREFMDQSPYLTAIYRDELARLAVADGFNLTIGEHGQPEITELMEMAKEHQRRSDEIELVMDRIEEYAGIELSQREKAAVVRASRGLDLEKFKETWDRRKGEFDTLKSLDPKTAETDRRELLKAFTGMVQGCSDSKLSVISTEEVRVKQQVSVTPEQWEILEKLKATREPKRQMVKPDLDRSIDYAIERMFQDKSVIKTYQLYEAIIQHAQGLGVNLEEMKEKVAKDPRLVIGRRNEVGSAEHYRQELETTLMIEKGREKGVSVSTHGLSKRLSELQTNAVKSLLESRQQFTALSGSSGVGKTEYVIAPLIEQNIKAGRQVFVVAPSDSARDVLRKAASQLPPSSSAVSVLKSAESLQLYQADPRLRERLGPGDLLIIDEASFISLKQGHKVLDDAFNRGVRVCFIGDLDQGKSIEAGDFFRLAIQSGIHMAEFHEIKRQPPDALDGHYLKAVKLFKDGKTTEAFHELHQAGCIHESKGQDRIDAIADSIVRSQVEDVSAIATNLTHRENNAVAEAVRKRMTEQGRLTEERAVTVYETLGWKDAEKREITRLKSGMVLEQTRGKEKGRAWHVESVDGGRAVARSNGKVREFNQSHMLAVDVCQERQIQIAIGDDILSRSTSKRDGVLNGESFKVAGWDELGNPISADGRTVTHRNLCHAYAATVRRVQGDSATRVIVGYDRHSIRTATRDAAYVAGGRGRLFCEIHVESVSDLSLIEKRSSDRQAVCEMTVNDLRPEIRELVQRVEAAKNGERRMEKSPADLQQDKHFKPLVEIPNHLNQVIQHQPYISDPGREHELER